MKPTALFARIRGIAAVAPPLLVALCAAGCIEPIGGTLVKRDYRPQVLVAYRAEGDFAPTARYYLVREKGNLAVFEQEEDGTGVLMERHWTDAYGDHFAVWAVQGSAYEILVPRDQRLAAYRFVYEPGQFTLETRAGVERPVPRMLTEASTALVPAGVELRAPIVRKTPARDAQNDDLFH